MDVSGSRSIIEISKFEQTFDISKFMKEGNGAFTLMMFVFVTHICSNAAIPC